MNRQHLYAFFWLRRRLFLNRMKKGGITNAVILAVLAAAGVLLVLFMFAAFFVVGLVLLADAAPAIVMYVWDGLVLVFLFWWTLGIVTDLQRSEALSLEKFLHLPVSLTGAFLINYLSSLLSLSMILFLPAMLGLTLGLVFAKGPALLLVLPLLAAFLFVVTALTYQFQGWLASLMANKRRRQTIIVLLTMSTILFCQLPNLLNIVHPWQNKGPDERVTHHQEDLAKLDGALKAGEITPVEFNQENDRLQREFEVQTKERNRQTEETMAWAAEQANLFLPPGWLPLGAGKLAHGEVIPALLGTLGLGLFGAASLWRGYRTTVRYYTGQFNAGKKHAAVAVVAPVKLGTSSAAFLEKKLPWMSEPTAAIALASFRSLLRAPEAKMMLLSPVLMVVIFGSMFLTRSIDMPALARPLLPFGAMGMVLLSMVALVGNQFGFDRNGFRVYVLSPVARHDILLGKNLAIAPLALGLGVVLAILLEIVYPLRLDQLLAVPFQLLSMFLVFCILANGLSIIVPMAIPVGSLKSTQAKGLPILLNLAFVVVFPLALLPTLLPLGAEVLLNHLGFMEGMPIGLVLTVVECAGIVLLYRLGISLQGAWLQRREQKILELVTVKSD